MSSAEIYEYGTTDYHGVPKFSCLDCAFDTLEDESRMVAHCRQRSHGIYRDGGMPEAEYIARFSVETPPVIITLGYLCWNTKVASMEGAQALVEEAGRLRRLGCTAHIVIVDNGSDDGTGRAIADRLQGSGIDLTLNKSNRGISAARNQIVDAAVSNGSDMLLLMDGDIEVVPLSTHVMTRYLLCKDESNGKVGCLGAYSSNFTKDRKLASKILTAFSEARVKNNINCAWTQYGVFRVDMFREGIRFDESGPFGEPGWGFEDDDLYFQMKQAGWANHYFSGIRYLHRNIRSSFPSLERSGVDLQVMYKNRKDFLLTKWKQKGFDSGILRTVTAQQMPG